MLICDYMCVIIDQELYVHPKDYYCKINEIALLNQQQNHPIIICLISKLDNCGC